jgi:hypothetical protein
VIRRYKSLCGNIRWDYFEAAPTRAKTRWRNVAGVQLGCEGVYRVQPATYFSVGSFVGSCEGFRTPAVTNVSPRAAAGVRKPPRDETAGRGRRWAVPRSQLWGFGHGRATAKVGGAVG